MMGRTIFLLVLFSTCCVKCDPTRTAIAQEVKDEYITEDEAISSLNPDDFLPLNLHEWDPRSEREPTVREPSAWEAPARERRAANAFSSFKNPYRSGKELGEKISGTLDELLGPRYDKKVRPGFGKRPVQVDINMSIQTMGPVDENTQAFYVDCYFRQSWLDDRLSYNTTGISELSLDWKILNLIWKPDTFFLNGKRSKMHKITVPNRFSRIAPDGRVSYSQRLTVHAACKMNLVKFPLDSQVCPLAIGSYGYPAEDLVYKWQTPPITITKGQLGLAQFSLVKWKNGVMTNETLRKLESGLRTDSIAMLQFHFKREFGFFLVQYYMPLLLIVMCSWVAFWIVKTDVPGRCGLGITTILSVAKLGFVGGDGPQVPYATAMDTFVVICFLSVFGSILEFAVINFISVSMGRYKQREAKKKERKDTLMEELAKAIDSKVNDAKSGADNPATGDNDPRVGTNDLKRRANDPRIGANDFKIGANDSEVGVNDFTVRASDPRIGASGPRVGVNETQAKANDAKAESIIQDCIKETETILRRRAPMASIEVGYIDEDGPLGASLGRGPGKDVIVANNVDADGVATLLATEGSATQDGAATILAAVAASALTSPDEDVTAKGHPAPGHSKKAKWWQKLHKSLELALAQTWSLLAPRPMSQMPFYKDTDDFLEQIDSHARFWFPTTYLILMVMYWTWYLYIMEDIVPEFRV